MINKIAIVPFMQIGRGQVGLGGYQNLFKKNRSTQLKENLEQALSHEKIDAKVIVDTNHGDLQGLRREGVDLMLLPSDVAMYADYTGIDKKTCYRLSYEEYENGEVAKVMEYIKNSGI